MSKNSLILLSFAGAVALCGSAAHAAPSQLYGKSVVVTWSEERSQRVNGESEIRNVTRSAQFSVYVSSAGKPFSRLTYLGLGSSGRGGLKSGNRDAVGGSGRRNVSFSGNSMNVVTTMNGGARNIVVSFDGGGCNANVIMGKESGSKAIRSTSIMTGASLEVLSVKTGAASCRIQDGNVFGE